MNILRLFTHRRREQDLDEEIQTHLAMATRDRIERGDAPHAARQTSGATRGASPEIPQRTARERLLDMAELRALSRLQPRLFGPRRYLDRQPRPTVSGGFRARDRHPRICYRQLFPGIR